MIWKLLLLLVLIIINGIFSATEMAFLSLNKYELSKEIRKNNKKAFKIVALLEDSSTFLSAIQIVITLSGFLASAFAAESFASEIALMIQPSWISLEHFTLLLVILITIALSYFTLVLGELVPKRIGLTYSKKIAFGMVSVIQAVIFLFKPFILILRSSTNFILWLLRVRAREIKEEEELKSNIQNANLEELEKKMLLRVFEFNDTTLKHIMTPKEDVISIDINDSNKQILEVMKKTKYTRFPVVEDGKMIGILNMKDVLIRQDKEFQLKKYMRSVEELDASMIIDDAFLLLNQRYEPIAKVVEDGIWIGIVTLEDIIEEIVGNVFDEYDQEKS